MAEGHCKSTKRKTERERARERKRKGAEGGRKLRYVLSFTSAAQSDSYQFKAVRTKRK